MMRPGKPEPTGRAKAVARIQAVMRTAANRNLFDLRAAMAQMDRLAAEFADDLQIRTLAEVVRSWCC